jgi:3'-phosphoadenosine 5'-phosphosulfate sulfotransferase (PAPS reductase)/FAD synthetase
MIISWFSAGVTSAVATHLAIEKYEDVKIIYFETGNHHQDNMRFINDCETWFNHPIEIVQHPKHKSIESVFRERKFLNSPYGAPCTLELKKNMRRHIEKTHRFTHQDKN